MAEGKPTKQSADTEFKFDEDLDFEGLDFNEPVIKEDRNPILRVAHGVFKGAFNQVRDSAFLKRTLKDILPAGYGQAIDLGDKVHTEARKLYDDSAKEIKPVIRDLKRVAPKVVPKDSKYVPQSVKDLLQRWEEEGRGSTRDVTTAELRDQGIKAHLEEMLKADVTMREQDRQEDLANQRLKEGLEINRHRDIFGELNKANITLRGIAGYQSSITLQYQKKMLETQYRQLFALQDILTETQRTQASLKEHLAVIVKNTALPDYKKIHKTEMLSQSGWRKLIDAGHRGLFGDRSSYIEGLLGGIRQRIQSSVKEATSAFQMGLSGAEMASDFAKDAAELGGGPDGYETAGDIVGGEGISQLAYGLGDKARERLKKNKRISKGGALLESMTNNISQKINEFRKDSSIAFDDSVMGAGKRILQSIIPAPGMVNTTFRRASVVDLEAPYAWTKKTDRSINEVIPGYLARILREQQIMRTGNPDIELIRYDFDGGKFMGTNKLIEKTLEKFLPKYQVASKRRSLDKLLEEIDPDGNLSPEAHEALKTHLMKNSASINPADFRHLASPSAYRQFDPQVAEQITPVMRKYLSSLTLEKRNDFEKRHHALKDSISDPRAAMERLVESGHGDMLAEMGLIGDRDRFNLDQFLRYYIHGDKPKLSGVAADKTVRPAVMGPVGPAPAGVQPGVIERLKTVLEEDETWSTKERFFETQFRVLGDKIAPRDEGKLWSEQKDFLSERFKEVVSVLLSNREATVDSGKLVARFILKATRASGRPSADQTVAESGDSQAPSFTDRLDRMRETGSDAFTRFMNSARERVGGRASRQTSSEEAEAPQFDDSIAGHSAGIFYKAVKGIEWGARKSVGMFRNNLRRSLKLTRAIGSNARDFWDKRVADVYVEGDEKPRLRKIGFRNGAYFDKDTGKVLRTPRDIKGPVVDANNNELISAEELSRLYVNTAGNKGLTALKFLAGKYLNLMNWSFRNTPKTTKAVWSAVKGSFNLSKKFYQLLDQPVDIYIKGEEDQPVLLARIMRNGGYFSQATGKVITRPGLIDGPVLDAQGNLALSLDQLKKGIVDVRGKPIRTPLGKMFGWVKDGMNLMARTMGIGWDLTKRNFRGIKRMFQGFSLEFTSGRQLTVLEEIRDILKSRFGKNKRVIGDTDGDGVRENSWQDLRRKAAQRVKDSKDKFARAKDGKKKDGDSGLFTMLGSIVRGLTSGVGKLVGLLGRGLGLATKVIPLLGTLGKLGGGAALTAGRLAIAAAPALAGAVTAGAGMLGSAAVAAGGAIATLAGGALAVLSSPIVLGAAAVALVGYGLYRGYKYFKGKLGSFAKLRYVQYGFNVADPQYVPAVKDTENFLRPLIIGEGNDIAIDEGRMDVKKLCSFWGVDHKDEKQLQTFFTWYQERFKPVYLTHVLACSSLAKSKDLVTADQLKGDEKREYLASVKFPEGPYDSRALPTADMKFTPSGRKEVSAIIKEIEAELEKEPKTKSSGKITEQGKETKPASAIATKPSNNVFLNSFTSELNKDTDPSRALRMDLTSSVPGSVMKGMGQVAALDAVRYRAYGISELTADKVRAIVTLESRISQKLVFDGSDRASWSGNAQEVLKENMGLFGVAGALSTDAANWLTWFNKRFLPVYLVFISGYKHLTGRSVLSEGGLALLKIEQQLDIARQIAGVAGIWSEMASPWPGEKLNADASSVKPNLEYLDSIAKKTKLDEEKKAKEQQAAASKPTLAKDQRPPEEQRRKYQFVHVPTDAEVMEKKAAAAAGGEGGAKGGNVSPGTLRAAGGPHADGREGSAYLSFASGVSLDGVQPALAKNFMGMVEEYGKLTGKKVQVNDGFRTYEQQAAMKRKYGPRAANPGNSLHEFGLALDVNSDTLNEMEKLGLMRKYGFTRPVGGEPWHMEPAGIQVDVNRFKRDQLAADQVIKESLGRGGGGFGTIPNAPKYARNRDLAIKLLSAPASEVKNDQKLAKAASETITATAVPAPKQAAEPATVSPAKKPELSSGGYGTSASSVSAQDTGGFMKASYVPADSETKPSAKSTMPISAGFSTSANVSKAMPGDPTVKVPDPKGGGYEGVKGTIEAAAKMVGTDPSLALAVAAIESSFNPKAKAEETSASGLFQFTEGTWAAMLDKYGRKYGFQPGTSPFDAKANAILGAHYIKEGAQYLSTRVKRTVGAVEAYLAHFLGPGGAATFLNALETNPDAIGAEVMPKAARQNAPTFQDKSGRFKTVREIYAALQEKVRSKLQAYGLTTGVSDLSAKPVSEGSKPGTAADLPSKPAMRPLMASAPDQGEIQQASYRTQAVKEAVSQASKAAAQNPMNSAYGFTSDSMSRSENTRNAQANDVGASLAPIENVLKESLSVQTRTLEAIVELVKIVKSNSGSTGAKSDPNAPPDPKAAPKAQPAPYRANPVPVPMKKSMV